MTNWKGLVCQQLQKKLGVELVEHHRAIYDTRACYGIFNELMNRVQSEEIKVDNMNDFPYYVTMDFRSLKKPKK